MSKEFICPECGGELGQGATLCPSCGFPIESAYEDTYEEELGNAQPQPEAPAYQPEDNNISKPQVDEDNFWIVLLLGIGHFLYRIVYLLFVLPVDLWKKAILRMSYQRKNKSLDVDKINHELPFFVWLKRFFFDFVFDGIIIISWVAVAIAIPIIFFSHISLYVSHFEAYMATILPLVIAVFYLPVAISLLKDIITLTVILPSRWIVSFLRRPAKTYDLTHKQEK